MSDEPNVDLGLIARQQRQILAELGTMVAILHRLDGTMAGLVSEVRAMNGRHTRLESRVRALEQKP